MLYADLHIHLAQRRGNGYDEYTEYKEIFV